jgi:hypothetical protein
MDDWSTGTLEHWKLIFVTAIASSCLAGEQVITCSPQQLRGVPGEPLQLEVSIETDRALPAQLRIPHHPSLYLRTVEKIPIQRAAGGRYIQKRIIIWQGLEAASLTLTNLLVSFQGPEPAGTTASPRVQTLEKKCPDIRITIEDVEPATPPAKKEEE